jgi:hypothetical protein
MPARRMLSLTPPEPTSLSISTIFWTALLSLLIAASISFLKNFTMVRAFSLSRWRWRSFSSGYFVSRSLISAIYIPAVSALQKG